MSREVITIMSIFFTVHFTKRVNISRIMVLRYLKAVGVYRQTGCKKATWLLIKLLK